MHICTPHQASRGCPEGQGCFPGAAARQGLATPCVQGLQASAPWRQGVVHTHCFRCFAAQRGWVQGRAVGPAEGTSAWWYL